MIKVNFRGKIVEMGMNEAVEHCRDISNEYVEFRLTLPIGEDTYIFAPHEIKPDLHVKKEFDFGNYRWGYFRDDINQMISLDTSKEDIEKYLHYSRRDQEMWDQEIDSPLNYSEDFHIIIGEQATFYHGRIMFSPNPRVSSGGYKYTLDEDFNNWYKHNVCTGKHSYTCHH